MYYMVAAPRVANAAARFLELHWAAKKAYCTSKLDGVGPVDNRPYTD